MVSRAATVQRARERPRLAAEITNIAHVQADLLGDLARHTRLKRFAGLDETGQQGEQPRRPHGLAGQHRTFAAVVHQADDGRIDTREFLMAGEQITPCPATPDRRGRGTVMSRETRTAMPIQQRRLTKRASLLNNVARLGRVVRARDGCGGHKTARIPINHAWSSANPA
jgi:hypothetical protein